MSIPQSQAGDIIDVTPLGPTLATARTTTLLKTDTLQLVRLVVRAGTEIPSHQAPGDITVQCLEGRVAFTSGGTTHDLKAGQLLYLPRQEPHTLRAIEDASLLVTIRLG